MHATLPCRFGYEDPVYAAVHAALPTSFPPAFPGLLRNASPYMHWPASPVAPHPHPLLNLSHSWDWRMWTGAGGAGGQREYVTASGMTRLEACAAGPCDGGGLGRAGARPAWGSGCNANLISGWDWLQFPGGVGATPQLTVRGADAGPHHLVCAHRPPPPTLCAGV